MAIKKDSPAAADLAKLEHERLSSLINSMADGVIALGEDGKIVLYNGAALNILDANTTMTGLKIEKVLSLVDKHGQAINAKKLITTVKTPITSRDLRLPYADGSLINLYISIAPVRLGYGHKGSGGFVVLLRDITREKSLEEERDEFISVVSHELRTPIAIAEGNIGNAQFIVGRANSINEVKEALSQAHDQVLFLSEMINDLSTLSRAERGVLQVDVEPINVHDLTLTLEKTYSQQAARKNLTFKASIDPAVEMLSSSRLYVREILQNFITNAIKYTDQGGITVEVKPTPEGVRFSVSDTGIGISKSDQDRVWDKFFRSEDFRTRKNSGTGLGLYVTLKLARLIQADIKLDSTLNEGSTFLISIPNLKVTKQPKKA